MNGKRPMREGAPVCCQPLGCVVQEEFDYSITEVVVVVVVVEVVVVVGHALNTPVLPPTVSFLSYPFTTGRQPPRPPVPGKRGITYIHPRHHLPQPGNGRRGHNTRNGSN